MSLEMAWKQNILVIDSNLLKSQLVVFGFGSQAFICEFSRQNICSVLGSPSFATLYLFGFVMNKLCCEVFDAHCLFSFSYKELCSPPRVDINWSNNTVNVEIRSWRRINHVTTNTTSTRYIFTYLKSVA